MTPVMPNAVGRYIEETIEKMDGWCTPEKARKMADLVLKEKPQLCLEIGVFAGRSLFAIALALKENGTGKVYGVDPWKKEESTKGFEDVNKQWWGDLNHDQIYAQCAEKLAALDLASCCNLLRLSSAEALPFFRDRRIDALSLDGNHSEASSCFDVKNYLPLVRPGGVIWFDDNDWPETQKAIRLIEKTCQPVDSFGNCSVFQKR